ncbi:MAG: phytoene synthase [Pseudomonadota bacterium]|jgi:phytoene synthase
MLPTVTETGAAAALSAMEAERRDLAACRAALRAGSRTFWAASLLLPPGVRDAATALYAFCRAADDAVDGQGDHATAPGADGPPPCAIAAAADLRHRLDAVYAGNPRPHPVDRSFARVVARFAIPYALPSALIEGMEWDAVGRRYRSLDDLAAYAARVAGTVGAMMALLMGVRDPAALARACDLGIAMQYSNIARDIAEDAANGRLYLPTDWLAEAGIDPDRFTDAPRAGPSLTRIVIRLLAEADRLYTRAEDGIACLPPACRPGIAAARFLYAEIGREVERAGPALLDRRAVVGPRRKLELLPRSLAASGWKPGPALAVPPLAAVDFLVRAVIAGPAPPLPAMFTGPAPGRFMQVLNLFEQLERGEKAGRPGARRGPGLNRGYTG